MDVAVRRVRPEDALVAKEVRLAALLDSPFAFGSTHAAEVDRTDDEWLSWAIKGSTGRARTIYLAWIDGRAGGIVAGHRHERDLDAVELMSMWTAPHARRAGIGGRLVRAVVDWAIETGSTSVGLWVTRGNAPAQGLYESLGFAEIGEYRPLPSDPCKDEVRMRLALDRLDQNRRSRRPSA